MISSDEQARLANVIGDVEDETSGEIVLVIAEQAGHYRAVPLLWAMLAALVTPWPLIWLTDISTSRVFLIQLAVALASSLALSWPKLRFALVPRSIKHTQAHEAASREFLRRGLTRTREKTGVLIYLALAEHHAEILADTGIADKVDPETWAGIVADLTAAIRNEQMIEGLEQAIRRVGAILAEHAPPRRDDVDELPNKVILLD
ncbi:TPM domain-containing protein [Microvirga sp. CF3062]|uniref:TPM domain-containing protein n=1 Tax=Microvirga sp. CF3062 TaxID=3110182 RepID=UPI002E77CC3B|nr:TPM domain-containing protein [Microvirga sp. CF3062]MEE1656654.1 TPM domain-containing protein [Microvirga sp. CF3062]